MNGDALIQAKTAIEAIAAIVSGKAVIGSGALASGGKLAPARFKAQPASTEEVEACACSKAQYVVQIEKADEEQQTVTGVVLQPEVVDAQGDVYSADVIRTAAHGFLAQFNKKTKLGQQHKNFTAGRFALVESYLAPMGFVINGKTVKEGSWVMAVKVLDPEVWKAVKEGRVTGFSIGGKAKVQQLVKAPAL